LKREAFIEPHKAWFERAIKKTKDDSLRKWIGEKIISLELMKQWKKSCLKPQRRRTRKARKWYQKDVIKYIKSHQEVIKKDIAKKLISLKKKYRLIQ